MSLFQDMDLGEMGPDFQSTVYFFSGCWFNLLRNELPINIKCITKKDNFSIGRSATFQSSPIIF